MKKIFTLLLISLLVLTSCTKKQQPKYIFLFIGDGFGLSQSMLAEDFLDVEAGDTSTIHLDLLKMPVSGYQTTYSDNSLVTDSAASGTALATGHKTNNNMLGVRPDSTVLSTIAEKLHKDGYMIGLLSTVAIDHATPGAFYGKVANRHNYKTISAQLAETGFEFLGGGGLLSSRHNDSIWINMENHGYTILDDTTQINNFQYKDGKIFAKSRTLLRSQEIPYVIDNQNYDMNLTYFVDKMIKYFEPTEKPFFTMIEGGKIDWSCHGNDPATTLYEVLDMNNAFLKALAFYKRHPNNTLIVMTADHETGGLSIGQNSTGYAAYPSVLTHQTISEDIFIQKIDKFAKAGKYSLKQLYNLIEKDFGFNSADEPKLKLNKKDSARIKLIFRKRFYGNSKYISNKLQAYDLHEKTTIASLCIQIMSEKAGMGWTSREHTGIAVPVRAIGCGAEEFSGFYDNTDIPKKIMKVMGKSMTN
ncbi:MAG: alkaline phosphatase [Bacteroidales bacterium]